MEEEPRRADFLTRLSGKRLFVFNEKLLREKEGWEGVI